MNIASLIVFDERCFIKRIGVRMMIQTEMRNSLEAVRAALMARPDDAITGSQVHSLIYSVAPELNVRAIVGIPSGPGALTKFVQEYLSDSLERIGNHGGDVLYGIIGHHRPAHDLRETSGIWRTFVSPGSRLNIVCDHEDKKLKLVEDDLIEQDRFVEIPKASLEEHDELRQEFIDQLEPSRAEEVNEAVNPNSEFEAWIGTLRTEFPSLYRAWGNFRKQKLLDLFLERVSIVGLEGDDRESLLQQIKASHFAAYDNARHVRFQTGSQSNTKRPAQTRYDKPLTEVEEARTLVHLAVDIMAHDDLRAIKLPLGVVLDAIQKRG